jgi:hypothetical protein
MIEVATIARIVANSTFSAATSPVEVAALRHDRQLCPGRNRVLDDIDAADAGPSAGGAYARGKHPDGRRLASAVWAQQGEHLASAHGEGDAVHRVDLRLWVALEKIFDENRVELPGRVCRALISD